MAIQLDRLDQQTTPNEVVRILRNAILSGKIPAGTPLRETHIANDLGISRGPLREALTRLQEEGLLQKTPYRGAQVIEVSARTIAEIASLRYLVEPFAAERSMDALRGPERHKLEEAVKALYAAADKGDIPETIDAHLGFHSLFYEYADHELLTELWGSWSSMLKLFFIADHGLYADLHEVAKAHAELAEIYLNEDSETFKKALAHHVHTAPGVALDTELPGAFAR